MERYIVKISLFPNLSKPQNFLRKKHDKNYSKFYFGKKSTNIDYDFLNIFLIN